MLHFFTDFGWQGPYVGQMHAAACRHMHANGIPVVDLMHDAPVHDPRAAAYLLAALARRMAPGDVCVGVVDPGVGTSRRPLIMRAGDVYFVGPDNGLFEIAARRASAADASSAEAFAITWRPEILSASFHGRDLFAPVAAKLAQHLAAGPANRDWIGTLAAPCAAPTVAACWPDELDEVVYVDRFGNCVLGRRAETLLPGTPVRVGADRLPAARTFGDMPAGAGFRYENSMGLVEIAVNRGSAAERYGLTIGSPVAIG